MICTNQSYFIINFQSMTVGSCNNSNSSCIIISKCANSNCFTSNINKCILSKGCTNTISNVCRSNSSCRSYIKFLSTSNWNISNSIEIIISSIWYRWYTRNSNSIANIIISTCYCYDCFSISCGSCNSNHSKSIANTICTTTIHNLNVGNITWCIDRNLCCCITASCWTSKSYKAGIIKIRSSSRSISSTTITNTNTDFSNSIQSMVNWGMNCMSNSWRNWNNISNSNTNIGINKNFINSFFSKTITNIIYYNLTNQFGWCKWFSLFWIYLWIILINLWIKFFYGLWILFIVKRGNSWRIWCV